MHNTKIFMPPPLSTTSDGDLLSQKKKKNASRNLHAMSLCKIRRNTYFIIASCAFNDRKTNISIPLMFRNVMDQKFRDLFSLGDIIHICGSPGSGKTQLVLQLCVCVQIPKFLHGLGSEAIFIDTDSGFSIAKISEIAEAVVDECKNLGQCHDKRENVNEFTVETILKKIHYLQISSYHELLAAVHSLHSFLTKHLMVKLIVIDSLVFPFIGMSNTLERTRLVLTVINKLHHLAGMFNLVVVITNHMVTKVTKQTSYILPSMGESVSHSIPQTLWLHKVGNHFYATVLKSNKLPNSEIMLEVPRRGQQIWEK
ncbi:DNA repair protein RAD51 homolog 3 [Cimex lectularius]|uniref:DNA repair protein RAD51 homolog 3 n=1 Tax=Cimex lectularius TaxID=79782 RepID=A0A8I6THF3_CIMLE|nr:DNA repair protein RAD51 homolog 3 [Cimex lectularius]